MPFNQAFSECVVNVEIMACLDFNIREILNNNNVCQSIVVLRLIHIKVGVYITSSTGFV